jgi:L-ascorbate metabolism protein UlaG (beta-lactamase superfamily)
VVSRMGSTAKAVIHYLFHSGFAVEYGDYFMIFDYYKLPGSTGVSGFSGKDLTDRIANYKHPFVFVSHSHHDHFNPVIFEWGKYNPSLTYILSSDVKQAHENMQKHWGSCYYMSPYDTMEKKGMVISTFGSTDIGVSFLLKAGDIRIFHAGDLNWWHWAEESTRQELEEEERKFKEETSKIEGGSIDILFFPVDPRLGEYYWLGGEYMLKTFKPGLFVPMHFGDNNYITQKFAERMKSFEAEIAVIKHKGQSFEYHKGDIRRNLP